MAASSLRAKLPSLPNLSELPLSWPEETHAKASAVLCLFMNHSQLGPSIVFTRRSSQLRSHAGQVGFPGGRRERNDADPRATALRETFEEIGLPKSHITILGGLAPLKSIDSMPVITVVGFTCAQPEDLIANPDEVAEIFLVPWQEFVSAKRSRVRFNIFGKWRETPFYEAKGHHIWGLTAWMLDNLGLED